MVKTLTSGSNTNMDSSCFIQKINIIFFNPIAKGKKVAKDKVAQSVQNVKTFQSDITHYFAK